MRIVIEGCDGTGKTTLASMLHAATDWAVHHVGNRPRTRDEVMARNRHFIDLAAREDNVIFDRWPLISERCYGDNGGTGVMEIHHSLRAAGIDRVIYCDEMDPGRLRVEARDDSQDREDTGEVLVRLELILSSYRSTMIQLRNFGHDVRRYNMLRGRI